MVVVSIQKVERRDMTTKIEKVGCLIDDAKPSAPFVGERLYPCDARACAAGILDRIADRHAFRVSRAYFCKPHAVKLKVFTLYRSLNDSTGTCGLEGVPELQDACEVVLIIDAEMDIRIVDDGLRVVMAQYRLPRLLCRNCRDIETALSEADNAAVFAKNVPRRVGFRLKVRAREWRVIRPAEHVTPQKEAHGPRTWHSRRAGWYTPRIGGISVQDKGLRPWRADGYSAGNEFL